ncbi:hypothetical protein C8R44DRAFT_762817 [Mycena epipterygia]|nr:hypothetical protein C8R44DRAFT_762817 [Mycena epipterygia]
MYRPRAWGIAIRRRFCLDQLLPIFLPHVQNFAPGPLQVRPTLYNSTRPREFKLHHLLEAP